MSFSLEMPKDGSEDGACVIWTQAEILCAVNLCHSSEDFSSNLVRRQNHPCSSFRAIFPHGGFLFAFPPPPCNQWHLDVTGILLHTKLRTGLLGEVGGRVDPLLWHFTHFLCFDFERHPVNTCVNTTYLILFYLCLFLSYNWLILKMLYTLHLLLVTPH